MIKILQQIKSPNLNLTVLIDNRNASFELEVHWFDQIPGNKKPLTIRFVSGLLSVVPSGLKPGGRFKIVQNNMFILLNS